MVEAFLNGYFSNNLEFCWFSSYENFRNYFTRSQNPTFKIKKLINVSEFSQADNLTDFPLNLKWDAISIL